MAHKHHPKLSVCPNCQRNLAPDDNFCPKCGQENHDLRLPFGHVIYEVVEGITHFDGKLWVTLRDIFTRPGQVPLDFIEGRRMRHVPPIRLYIFVSFLLFLLINASFYGERERRTLREERLKAAYGPNKAYRELTFETLFAAAKRPAPVLASVDDISFHFPLADSTGAQTLRRWRGFTDTQLDSALRLYNRTVYAKQRSDLRQVLNALPAELPYLRLREPANTLPWEVPQPLLKQAKFPQRKGVELRFLPGDTLGRALFTRLKRLNASERATYAVFNKTGSAPEDPVYTQAFSRLVDMLQPRQPNNPLKFRFMKGLSMIDGITYTSEAAARADLDRMRLMTPEQRLQLYSQRTGESLEKMGFWGRFFVRRNLTQYVQTFERSESEIVDAQLEKLIKYVSYSFFVLMPVVAVFLYFVYRRSKRYFYVDHLIFSINMHTVGFILLLFVYALFEYTLLVVYVNELTGLSLLFLPLPIFYFLLSLRTVYRQSWPKTLLKFLILSVLYSATFFLTVIGVFLLGLL